MERNLIVLAGRREPKDNQSPDLAIEMYFPLPRDEESCELPHIKKQTDRMLRKLEKIDAKYKYILIGVPRDKMITTLELPHPNIKVVWQEYKFTKTKAEKPNSTTPYSKP